MLNPAESKLVDAARRDVREAHSVHNGIVLALIAVIDRLCDDQQQAVEMAQESLGRFACHDLTEVA